MADFVVERMMVELGMDPSDFKGGAAAAAKAAAAFQEKLEDLSSTFEDLGAEAAAREMTILKNAFVLGADIDPTVQQIMKLGEQMDDLVAQGAEVPPVLAEAYARFKELKAGAEEAGEGVEEFGEEINRNIKLAALWADAYETVKGALLALPGWMAASVDQALAMADQVTNLSQRTGVATEALQEFGEVGADVGVGMAEIGTGMQRLQRSIVGGSSATTQALEKLKLGLSLDELRRQKPEEQLQTIIAGLSGVTDEAQRTALAMQLLGRGGAALIPLGAGLEEARQKARDLGLVVSKETTAAVDNFGDAIGRLGRVIDSVGRNAANGLLGSPPLTEGVEFLTQKIGGLSRAVQTLNTPYREMVGLVVVSGKAFADNAASMIAFSAGIANIISALKDTGKLAGVTAGISGFLTGGVLAGASFASFFAYVNAAFAVGFAEAGVVGGTAAAASVTTTFAAKLAASSVFTTIGFTIGSAIVAGIVGYLTYKGTEAITNAISRSISGNDFADDLRNYFGNFGFKPDTSGSDNTAKLLAGKGFGPGMKKPKEEFFAAERIMGDEELQHHQARNALLIEEASLLAKKTGKVEDSIRVMRMEAAETLRGLELARLKIETIDPHTAAAINAEIAMRKKLLEIKIADARMADAAAKFQKSLDDAALRQAVRDASDQRDRDTLDRMGNEATPKGKPFMLSQDDAFTAWYDKYGRALKQKQEMADTKLGQHVIAIKKAEESARSWGASLQAVTNAFSALGIEADSVLGKILIGFMQAKTAAASIRATMLKAGGPNSSRTDQWNALNTDQKMEIGAQGLGTAISAFKSQSMAAGALSGAAFGSSFGAIGALVGGLAGGFAGLAGKIFGAAAALRKLREDFITANGGAEALKKEAQSLGLSLDKLYSSNAKDVKAFIDQFKKVKEVTASLHEAERAVRDLMNAFLAKGVAGMVRLFEDLAKSTDKSAEHFARLGRIGLAVFNSLIAAGRTLYEALEEMGPALDAALKAAEESGQNLGPLQALAAFRALLLANKDLIESVQALEGAFNAVRVTGSMTLPLLTDFATEAAAKWKALSDAGFSFEQIMVFMGPLLLAMAKSAEALGLDVAAFLDTITGGQGKEAAERLKGMKDPMDKMIEAQNIMILLIAALVEAFGKKLPEAVQAYIDILKKIPNSVPGPNVGNGSGGGNTGNNGNNGNNTGNNEAALGMSNAFFGPRGGGHWINVAEGGMGEYVTVSHGSQGGGKRVPRGVTHAALGYGEVEKEGSDSLLSYVGTAWKGDSLSGLVRSQQQQDQVEDLTNAVSSLVEAIADQGPAVTVNSNPTIVVEDKSMVKTREGQEAFQQQTLGVIDRALRMNENGLATRIRQVVNNS